MANKSIKELPKATQIQEDDALPMQQGSTTKQVTGLTMTLWLLAMADGHGGVKDFQKLSESGLEKTYQFTMADTTKYTFTVTDGNGVADFQHSVSDLVHTYKLIMDNGQEYTMTIKDGEKGDKGDNAYVWFRFASEKPTSSSSSMGEEADDWIGFYSGNKPTAPTDPMEYVWAPFRGRQGLTGDPATLIRSTVEYQVSTSATVEPSGNWSESIPAVPQGSYLWSRTTIQFNTGGIIQILNKSRDGLDGLGSVVSVNNISPGENGNVELTADDVEAVPKSGGTMTGPINMAGQPITGLNDPTEDTQAARKSYVDKKVSKKGDTMTGSLTVDHGANFACFINRRTVQDLIYELYAYVTTSGSVRVERRASEATENYLSLEASQTTLGKPLNLGSGGTGATTAANAMTNLGKVSGTYTGTGATTERTIDTGGTGNLLLIYNWANSFFALVVTRGAYKRTGNTVVGLGSTDCAYVNGTLKLTTTDACLNASGVTYNYICI